MVGAGFFRMCRLTEGVLKPFGFAKGEHHQMACHDWLSSKHVLIGTKTGKVLVLEDAELKSTVDVFAVIQIASAEPASLLQTSAPGVKERGGSLSTFSISSGSSSVVSEEKFINSLIAFKTGFVCSVGAGKVAVFELEKPLKELLGDDEVKFKVSHTVRLPSKMAASSSISGAAGAAGTLKNLGNKLTSLALNSNETMLVALTDTMQLVCYSFTDGPMSSTAGSGSVSRAAKVSEFTILCHPFHNGAVTGVDVCQRKPIVVTCGVDKTIRVWNYLSLEMELSKEFEENVSSVALHPTGLNILAGFTDKLRLMNLLIDDIKTFREFPLRNSRVCRFSCGGHLLSRMSVKP